MPSLKNLFFTIYLRAGYVPVRDFLRARLGRARAVVLCYHRIGERDVLTTPPANFQRDLAYLQAHYECLSLHELCARINSSQALRRPVAAVTFDDGYRDNFTHAVPLLQAAGVPATFFVATGFMSTDRTFDHDAGAPVDYPKMTWDDLRAMQDRGFEIGSHTINHADLGSVSEDELETELGDSLAALQRELGERPRAFAFPYGKPHNITVTALKLARRAGYYAALAAYGGDNTRGASLFPVRRVDAGNGCLGWPAWQARVAGCDPDYLRLKLRQGRAV